MKKQHKTLFLLSIIMTFVFFSILYFQIKHIKDSIEDRDTHFNESIQRIFNDILLRIEEIEADQYISDYLSIDKNKINIIHTHNTDFSNITKFNDNYFEKRRKLLDSTALSLTDKNKINKIEHSSQILQEQLKKQYISHQKTLDKIALKWLCESSKKPLEERIDFEDLDFIISKSLLDHGINLEYHFSITDQEENEIFRCHDFVLAKKTDIFKLKLFPNENQEKSYYLNINFPTKNHHTSKAMSTIMHSIMLTSLLLIVFITILFIVFNQKKLSDMKYDFINNMTHELKTPISTISLASQMLQDKEIHKTPETLSHISNIIREETKRLRFLIEKVLQVSMFEHEKIILKTIEADANELIKNITSNFSIKVESKGGAIKTNLKAKNPRILINEIHFTNVIYNLMDNALKYKKETEPLILNIETYNDKNDDLIISIKDNGIGIKKEYFKKMFDRLYRIPTGNTHNVKGFGLGLAYVKKIIKEHEGTITLESEINKGSKFSIKIPTLTK